MKNKGDAVASPYPLCRIFKTRAWKRTVSVRVQSAECLDRHGDEASSDPLHFHGLFPGFFSLGRERQSIGDPVLVEFWFRAEGHQDVVLLNFAEFVVIGHVTDDFLGIPDLDFRGFPQNLDDPAEPFEKLPDRSPERKINHLIGQFIAVSDMDFPRDQLFNDQAVRAFDPEKPGFKPKGFVAGLGIRKKKTPRDQIILVPDEVPQALAFDLDIHLGHRKEAVFDFR